MKLDSQRDRSCFLTTLFKKCQWYCSILISAQSYKDAKIHYIQPGLPCDLPSWPLFPGHDCIASSVWSHQLLDRLPNYPTDGDLVFWHFSQQKTIGLACRGPGCLLPFQGSLCLSVSFLEKCVADTVKNAIIVLTRTLIILLTRTLIIVLKRTLITVLTRTRTLIIVLTRTLIIVLTRTLTPWLFRFRSPQLSENNLMLRHPYSCFLER